MGSKRRQEAIASGKIVENAEAVRRRRRAEAGYIREELAIVLTARGLKATEIEAELFKQTGARCHGNVPALVRRGLYRRSQENAQEIAAAKEMLLAQYRPLIETYMPRALGDLRDPDTGQLLPPDPRAADLVLKILDKVGQVTGAMAPPRAGDVNLHLQLGNQAPPDAATARELALKQLERTRDKHREIEGALADTPAVEGHDGPDGEDMPPPFQFDLPAAPD